MTIQHGGKEVTAEGLKTLMGMYVGDEPLHPDLAARLVTSQLAGHDMQRICHPLVDAPFYMEQMNPHYNRMLAGKQEALARAQTNKDWYTYVFLHEKPFRREALVDIFDRASDRQWWALVGEVWKSIEFPSQELDEWQDLWATYRPGREAAIDPDDQAVWDAMPPLITVYRGVGHRYNDDGERTLGLSWTVSREKAEWFARRFARDGDRPGIWSGYMLRSDAFAYLGGRGEQEVVCFPFRPNLIRWIPLT